MRGWAALALGMVLAASMPAGSDEHRGGDGRRGEHLDGDRRGDERRGDHPRGGERGGGDGQAGERSGVDPSGDGRGDRAELLRRGHRKKVIGATLIAVGSAFDAATTALTLAGLVRGGWSLAPRDTTDAALLWSGVAGNFVLDTVLTVGIVVYCDGGQLMRRER